MKINEGPPGPPGGTGGADAEEIQRAPRNPLTWGTGGEPRGTPRSPGNPKEPWRTKGKPGESWAPGNLGLPGAPRFLGRVWGSPLYEDFHK